MSLGIGRQAVEQSLHSARSGIGPMNPAFLLAKKHADRRGWGQLMLGIAASTQTLPVAV
jgi:hypothetical protein